MEFCYQCIVKPTDLPIIVFYKDNIKVTAHKETVFKFVQPVPLQIIIPDPVEPVIIEPFDQDKNKTIISSSTSLETKN